MFACALFLGSSLATYLTAGLAEEGQYGTIFALSFALGIVLAAAATAGYAAWKRRQASLGGSRALLKDLPGGS
ncbi:hypothetical protein [Pseudarthrobacter albicanus]|uniref:hypothetical protein n=1 Tax=Pseudarthrobacter albicanus TaxID=2823873 RepID=UPI001BAD8DC9|nr:hypothetical protein [Pseudarthrobacter albicanus]